MKTLFQLIFLSIITSSVLTAQSDTLNAGNDSLATVYFYRLYNYYGSAVKMKILANDQPVVRLKNASYYTFQTPPGDYYFRASMGTESRIRVKLEPGEDYYVKAAIVPGFWSGHPQLELVDSIEGSSVIRGGMLSAQSFKPISMERPKSRIGLVMEGGFGFESIPLFVNEDNDEVTLSSGGGFGIGLEYGYEVSRYFDISLNGFYQGSSLSMPLENASASFNRMGITLTPALIIPVKSGDYYRFKLGAGIGAYSLGKMYIDASEAGGTEMTFRYKPAFGAHLCFDF